MGKLHVYPQRNHIGFDDVHLLEEGRYEFGVVDDYQIWLGENGYLGQEFMHGMGNNNYLTRPWHLDERAHPTNWVTMEMMRQIKRKDPTRPAFYFCSYPFPHPPLAPLQSFLDMYREEEILEPVGDDWHDGRYIFDAMGEQERIYSEKEKRRARRTFFAQCTHIDYSIRMLIGTLRECNLLDDTILVFLSDHGDMLFDHGMVAKRCFYEESTRVPFLLSGKPLEHLEGSLIHDLAEMADVMPTLLDLCGVPIPETVEGRPLLAPDTPKREFVYGEVSEGNKATRMIRKGTYKLIYYPCGMYSSSSTWKKPPPNLMTFPPSRHWLRCGRNWNSCSSASCMATTWHGFGTVAWLDSKLLPTMKRPTTVCTISEVTTGLPPPAIPTKAKTHNQTPEAFCFRGFFHPSRNIQIVFSLHLFPVCMHRLDSPGPPIVC